MAQDTILTSDTVKSALLSKVNNDIAELFAAVAVASETHQGTIETATNAEAVAKSVTDRAIVPSNIPSIMSSPGPIGDSTPSTGAFTSVDIDGGTMDDVTIAGGSINNTPIGASTPSTGAFSSVDIDGGSIDGTAIGGTTPSTGAFTTVDIDGGTIDDTAIGGTTPSTGAFSTVDIDGGSIDGTAIGGTTPSTGAFTTVDIDGGTMDDVTIAGGSINNTPIGASTPSTGAFSTVDIDGGNIDDTVIGNTTAAAGTFTELNLKSASGSDANLIIDTTDADNPTSDAVIQLREAGSTKWYVGNDGDDSDKFKIGLTGFSTTKFAIQQDGNVGIGTTSPSYTLHVSGDIYCSGKLTSAGGNDPPYVLYNYETRQSVVNRIKREISPDKLTGAILFYNGQESQMEIFLPSKGEFRDISGKLLTSTEAISKTFKVRDKYFLDGKTGELEKVKVPVSPNYYKLKKGYYLDDDSGTFIKEDASGKKEIVTREEALEWMK